MFSLDAPLAPAIDAFVDPENDENAQKTGLNTVVMQVHRQVSMETLIQALGAYLTNGDDKVRSRATLLLAEVLTRLPELQLAPSAVQLLMTFFADRLADFPSASACLRALLALETHHAAQVSSPRTTVALILKLGTTLHIPQLGQAMRKMCFDLMELALAQNSVVELLLDSVPASSDAQDASVDDAEQSEDLGRQFVQTFLSAMEGEKDPRNLLLCMQVARTLLAKLEPVFSRSDALLQQYFDVVSCYFPIIFTPPPNDPYGITSEGLILSLRHAFAASDLLAPLVLPFLLKKLASTVVEAKLDALQTLVFCGERYSVNALLLQMHAVATALYDEVLDGEKQEVITEARQAISRFSGIVARAKAQETPGAAYAWSKFVVELTARAVSELREHAADSMVSVSAGQVLAALGHESSMSFAHVLKIAVPLLVEQLQAESSGSESVPSKCEAALARILLLVDTIDREIDQSGQAQPMRPHAPVLIDALANFLSADQEDQANPGSSVTARCVAAEALCHLLTFPPSPIVAHEQVKALINLFTRLLLLDPAPEVRGACLQSLKEISTVSTSSTSSISSGEPPAAGGYAGFVVEISLARLMAAVNESSDLEDDDEEEGSGVAAVLAASNRSFDSFFEEALQAITELCRESSIFQATIFLLIDLCVRKDASSEGVFAFCDADSDAARRRHVSCLLDAVAKIVEINSGDRASMEFCVQATSSASIVFRLLTAVETSAARATSSASDNQPGLVDDAKLTACVRIFRAVMQNVSPSTQQRLVDAIVPAFLRTHPSEPASLQLVPLFAAVINSATREVSLPQTPLVINRFLDLAQSGSGSTTESGSPSSAEARRLQAVYTDAAVSAAKSLASIVNKMSDGAEFDALIDLLLTQKLAVVISDPSATFAVRVAALQIYAWIAKALVIRGHKTHAPMCLRFLCSFLTPGAQNDGEDVAMEQAEDEDQTKMNAALRMEVAKSFKLLVSEYPDVLNRKCGAIITFLYRQRLFDLVFPVLLEFIRSHIGEETSVAALVAFAQVIAHSPKAVYLPHLAQIFPLMVQAINTDDRELGSAAIQTFKPLLLESVENAKPFLKDVFPGLLKQAQFGAGAKDRHAALECLAKLATIPYELVHPYKDIVLRKLVLVLDDRKRLVRHMAVRVRNQWSIL
ncbi:mms19 nucleotide excision repair [Phytophthora boehmeriae]|uniref:MMS19 nucleotide excision repair protein n=1 Tax=Phytophthora boehmeriae TaxID=109152 RepID=A0A8T1WWS6_9STRA|nr:mms19 nucleotide excision repair [Phytophthora boehmeriae]